VSAFLNLVLTLNPRATDRIRHPQDRRLRQGNMIANRRTVRQIGLLALCAQIS
jgi:hypothetical protein